MNTIITRKKEYQRPGLFGDGWKAYTLRVHEKDSNQPNQLQIVYFLLN